MATSSVRVWEASSKQRRTHTRPHWESVQLVSTWASRSGHSGSRRCVHLLKNMSTHSVLGGLINDVDTDGRVTVRVLHDGTNSLSVNSHIKVRDTGYSPTASDIKKMLRLKSEMGLRMVGSTTDIKSAHRLITVPRRDWRHLGCRIRPGRGPPFKSAPDVWHLCGVDVFCAGRLIAGLAGSQCRSTPLASLRPPSC